MDGFRVEYWGQAVGQGVSGARFVNVSAVGKTNTEVDPYFVANELVASELGRILRLPVPPGFVIVDAEGDPHFASLDFNLTGDTLPPIIPDNFSAAFTTQLGAILTYDILIANSDRHTSNLSADYSSNPPRFNLFDHSHSLLGGSHHGDIGIARLNQVEDAVVIDGGFGGSLHVLVEKIDDENLFFEWISRIEAIPDYFIREVVNEAAEYGLNGAESGRLIQFLLDRKNKVKDLISQNKPVFSSITEWSAL